MIAGEAFDFRQGDVVLLDPLGQCGVSVGLDPMAACEVAIISQTCDLVQASKEYCLVAPIISASPSERSAARNGKKPLLLYLEDGTVAGPWISDLGRAFSLHKSQIRGVPRIARCVERASSVEARRLGARIGRAFGRFPFPDEVYPVFAKMQDRLRDKAGTRGNLGQVIDLVAEVRVSADQWDAPARKLALHVIVPSEFLIPEEDIDPSWAWDRVIGWKANDSPGNLTLDRVCELILANRYGDLSSLLNLWAEFGQSLSTTLLEPYLNDEVVAVEVHVVSDIDFTHRDMAHSESLDLETLSDTATPGVLPQGRGN